MSDLKRLLDVETKHPKEDVRRIFGRTSDSAEAVKTKKENPKLYEELKHDVLAMKLIGGAEIPRLLSEHTERFAPDLTWDEIAARSRHSEAECRAVFVASERNAAKLKAEDPARYQEMKTAHQSYITRPKVYAVPLQPDSSRSPLNAELAKKFNLPENYRISSDEFERLMKLQIENNELARIRAEEKTQVELTQRAEAAGVSEQVLHTSDYLKNQH